MCEKCNQEEFELLPEFETIINEYSGEIFPELEFEVMNEVAGAARNTPAFNKWVQCSLNQLLALKLGSDGIIGPVTRSAIRNFQRQKGLKDDGIVGPKTEEALKTSIAAIQSFYSGNKPMARRLVDPKKVSCLTSPYRDAIFKNIGTNDPVSVLEKVCQRAVEMLDNVIVELTRIKKEVIAGKAPTAPLISDFLAWSLRIRMQMNVNDRTAWAVTGSRSAWLIITRLTGIRKAISDGDIHYTCSWGMEGGACGKPAGQACCAPNREWAWSAENVFRIHLCPRFWIPAANICPWNHFEFQAQTLMHEASHITYDTNDSRLGPNAAECLSQMVAELNNSPIDDDFVGACGGAHP